MYTIKVNTESIKFHLAKLYFFLWRYLKTYGRRQFQNIDKLDNVIRECCARIPSMNNGRTTLQGHKHYD